MAFCELKIFSESLGVETTVNVIIPQKLNMNGEKHKCLYLLHGLSDDHSIWMRRTSIERYASQYGICIVMPFGSKSFYTDMKYGEKYYTYISEELTKLIQSFFNVSDKRENNYIAGLSMGGYGALKIALRNRNRFSAVAGLSSVTDIVSYSINSKELMTAIFGEELIIPDEENLFKLVENTTDPKPRIFIGVGTEDHLYDQNCRLRDEIKKYNYDLTYRESQGSHSWDFWDEYIKYVLEWLFNTDNELEGK